jgi:ligand-binding sensor domain-containing protein
MKPMTMAGAALLVAAAAFAGAGPAAAQSGAERVLETYQVGDNVYVRALTFHKSRNVLWVGTSGGVHEIDLASLRPKNTFTRDEGLANEYVFAVGVDSQDYVWFGTNAGGASRYKGGKWKTYFPMHGLADYWIYAFANQKDGSLWIGTWAGASHFNPKTGKFRNYVKELVNEWVYGIGVDAQDRVWFGTEGGVSMFDGKKWRSWTHKDGLGAPNTAGLQASDNTGLGTRARHDLSVHSEGIATYNPNYVFSLHVAPDGAVWAGTWGGGASRFDGTKWTNYTTAEGLAGNIVYSIIQDSKGVFWFGTNNGVSRYDGKTWRSFGRAEGLLDSNVYALAATPNGDVWAGTKRGVARIGR